MNRPEPPSQPRSTRPSSSPKGSERGRRRELRDDLEGTIFGVIWPLPRAQQFPTLARRWAALAIDLLLTLPALPLAVALTEAVSDFSLRKYDAVVRYALAGVLLYAVYFAYWESSPTRATPGKIVLDLRVATVSGKPLTFADAMIRFWLRLATVLSLNAGLGLAWRHPRGEALHDRCCGTVVVAHHVTPGQLRTAVRPPCRRDFVAVLAAGLAAYGLAFQLVPGIMRQLSLADRFDAAIVELTPALLAGDLVGKDGVWSPKVRAASDAIAELQLAIDVDSDNRLLVLRAPAALLAADTGQALLDPPMIRLERKSGDAGTGAWSCTKLGLAGYAPPRHCRGPSAAASEGNAALDYPVLLP